jgi:hypothetical protein
MAIARHQTGHDNTRENVRTATTVSKTAGVVWRMDYPTGSVSSGVSRLVM